MSSFNIPSSYGDSSGAMLALGNQRQQREADKVQAIRMGKGIQDQEQLEKKVRQVSEDFVSVFMNQVMKSMRATVQENPMMHGDNGEKFFQEMLDTEQSKQLAKGSGYGLTDLIYESMMASYRVSEVPQQNQETVPTENNGAGNEGIDEPEVAVEGIG